MVRFQRRVSKKRYLKGKRIYEYGRIYLNLPKKYHELIIPFLKRYLEMKLTVQDDPIVIVLTKKNVQSHP